MVVCYVAIGNDIIYTRNSNLVTTLAEFYLKANPDSFKSKRIFSLIK